VRKIDRSLLGELAANAIQANGASWICYNSSEGVRRNFCGGRVRKVDRSLLGELAANALRSDREREFVRWLCYNSSEGLRREFCGGRVRKVDRSLLGELAANACRNERWGDPLGGGKKRPLFVKTHCVRRGLVPRCAVSIWWTVLSVAEGGFFNVFIRPFIVFKSAVLMAR